jgi:hypothetical protein
MSYLIALRTSSSGKGVFHSMRIRSVRWHARLDHALLPHRKMESQLFIHPRTKVAPGEQSSKPNPNVNPELLKHHGAKGSITRLTASTIRRQLETSTVIRLRPRGVSL